MGSRSIEESLSMIRAVAGRREFQEAILRASENNQRNVERILRENPWLVDTAKRVKRAKEEVLSRLDYYVKKAMDSLERVKAKPYYASGAPEARSIVGEIVGSGKLVVLSKSMAAEEVGLREYLQSLGNEVWETDLGQLLVQLEGGRPMHTVAPAVHMDREAALKLLREKLGLDLGGGGVEEAVRAVREYLRVKFAGAYVGISGCNALAADTGSMVFVENEGNLRLVTGVPPVHVAIVPVDKIVPTLEDAFRVAIVQSAYAGLYPPTYISVVSGPSSTGDIEQVRVYGAHGPREVHVILLDNGRLEALEDPLLGLQLLCIRCGRCQFECPVWVHTGNYWGGPVYGGPMGLVWTAITHDASLSSALSHLCLDCMRCDLACPVEIPLSKIIWRLKRRSQGGA